MRTSTLKKVAAGLVLCLPVLLVLDFLQYRSVQIVAGTHQGLVRVNRLLSVQDVLLLRLRDAQADARDFAATGDRDAAKSFEIAVGEARDAVNELNQLAVGDTGRKARVEQLQSLTGRRLDLLRKTVELRDQKDFSADKVRPLENEGERIGKEIETLIRDGEKADLDQLKQRNAEARDSVLRANYITPFAAILGLWLVALAALLLYRDASERKWTGVERRLHTRLLETIPVSIFLADEAGLIFYTNPALDSLFSCASGDLIGRHVSILCDKPREEAEREFAEIFEKLTLNGYWTGQLACCRKDGTPFQCSVRAGNMDLPGKMYRVFALQETVDRG